MDKWLKDAVEEMQSMEEISRTPRSRDWEADHSRADEIMAEAVRRYVSEELADAFEKVGKWYA